MYRKAVNNKLRGGVISLIITAVFMAVFIIITEGAALYIFCAVIAAFMALIASSLFRYVTCLGELKEQYGYDLEADIDACEDHCSNKYFFFDDCLIYLANARMIFYSEIKSISGLTTRAHRTSSGHMGYAGAAVELKMSDGSSYMFTDFGSYAAKDSTDILDGYHKFCDYLAEYAPQSIE
ncbi:MAG: hypothetical protein IJM75_02480 [Ruminococcus sp.]|nr:hypothetical protein [Ruminococcus sp.]